MDSTPRMIGEIADASGMTVRALRYYEEIGLLEPTGRTTAGYRFYGPDAVAQVYRIARLRRMQIPLPLVQAALQPDASDAVPDVRVLLEHHLAQIEERLHAEQRLQARLRRAIGSLEPSDSPTEDAASALIDVLEDMTMLEATITRRIALLVYDDIEAAYDYLIEVFGFSPGEVTRDADGDAVHGEIHAGDGEFWLHPSDPNLGLATPASLGGASATMAIMVDDVDAHHAHATAHGATVRYGPMDQPYGYREYGALDPAGHLWSFMKPLG